MTSPPVLAEPATAPTGRVRGRRPLLLLGALTGLTPLAVDMYLPALPSLTRDLATTSSSAQLTLAALLVGLAAGQLVAGPLSDRFGRRPPVLAGLVGFVLASVGCALAPTVAALVGLRFLQGFAGAAAVVVARAVVRDLYDGVAAARAFATLMLIMGAAPVLAPVLGAQVLRGTSWRGVFGVLAAVGVALLVASWRALPETLDAARRTTGGLTTTLRLFRTLLRDPGLVLPALAGGAGFAAMFAYIAGSPYVLQELHGLSPQAYSAVFAANATALILLSQVSGRLVARTGSSTLLVAGACTSVAGAAVLLIGAMTGAALPVVLLGLLLVVGAVGLTAPNATALALAEHGATAGAASALLGVLQLLLGAAAAPLTGLGGARPDFAMALTIAVASSLALGCAVATARRQRRPAA